MEQKWDVDVCDMGYCKFGEGGVSTFIFGVNGSSFLTLILFLPFPLSQYSQFHQTIPNTPALFLLLLCISLNSLFNCTNFSASHLVLCNFLTLLIFLFILLCSASSM